MKIAIVSDLHLDHWHHLDIMSDGRIRDALKNVGVLILNGDVSDGPFLGNFLDMISSIVDSDKIRFVPGNHDYYNIHRTTGISDINEALRKVCDDHGITFHDRSSFSIGRRLFVTTTLWSCPTEWSRPVSDMLSDFRNMNHFDFDTFSEWHHDRKEWLMDCLKQHGDDNTIVVTHHVPHYDLVRNPEDRLTPFFASNVAAEIIELEGEMGRRLFDKWYYGHSHLPFSFIEREIGGHRFINTSLGYPFEYDHDKEKAVLRLVQLIEEPV